MAGNETLLAELARATSSIVTGGPGGRCRLCRFCVAAELPVFPSVELVTEAEFEAQLEAIAAEPASDARRIWFSYFEPFAHPRLCQFVETASRRLPERTFLVITNGLLTRPEQIELMNGLGNVVLGLGLNTLDPGLRTVLYGSPALRGATQVLRLAVRLGVAITDCGATELAERDLDLVLELRGGQPPPSVHIRRLEHTRSSPPEIRSLSEASKHSLPSTLERLLPRVDMYSTTDPDLILEHGAEKSEVDTLPSAEVALVVERLEAQRSTPTLFCSAPGSFAFWQRELAPYRDRVEVVSVANRAIGGSLDCAGFMTVSDVRRAATGADGRCVMLPKAMFGDLGRDILGHSRRELPADWQVL